MARSFLIKLKESFNAVFPITLVVLGLILFFIPTPTDLIVIFLISSGLLILGIALFSLGADSSMIELGSGIGATLSKKNKVWFMIFASFLIGFIITFAEPDLMVLASQVADYSSLSNIWIFISVVSVGVGFYMMIGILRIIFKLKFSTLLILTYGLIIILSFFVPAQFVPLSFDSGSVTTGPISVPFLIAFGLGLSAVRGDKGEDNCFGLIALCSAGPILSVMTLSMFLDASTVVPTSHTAVNLPVVQELFSQFASSLKDVAIVLLPIIALFLIFQIFSFKYPKQKVIRTLLGFLFTYLGISLFLTGVECGYLPMGTEIGEFLFRQDNNWVAIPIGFLLGAFAIIAEPALHVLKKQVENITSGIIKQRYIVVFMSIGVALAVAMAVVRALYDFNILFILIPVYAFSLLLSFYNSKMFTAISFDSGGVATGVMAVSFILPMITGLTFAGAGFGTVALIAAFPILTMQIFGLIYTLEVNKIKKFKAKIDLRENIIIEFDYKKKYVPVKPQNEIIEFNWKTKKEKV